MNKKTLKLEIGVVAELSDDKNIIRIAKGDSDVFFAFLRQIGVSASRKSDVSARYDEFGFHSQRQAEYIFNLWQ